MAEPSFDPFQHFVPDPCRIVAIERVRHAYRALQCSLEANCPPCRERSVAMTELETSAQWAIKSIVIQDHK